MADALPPELSRLFDASDPSARERAWAAFIEQHTRLLHHTARSFTEDYDDAMDRYAFVLEELRRDDFKRLRSYVADGRSKFTTWLVVVARRLCLDYHRQRYGRARTAQADEGSREEDRAARRRFIDFIAEEIDLSRIRDKSTSDPEARLREAELAAILEGVVARLEPRDRLLLKLRFTDALSVREVARIMRFPTVFHVYRRLNAVLGSLKDALEAKGIEDGAP